MGCGRTENYPSVGSVGAIENVYVVMYARRYGARLSCLNVKLVELPADLVVHGGVKDFGAVVGHVYVGDRAVRGENFFGVFGRRYVSGDPELVLKIVGIRPSLMEARVGKDAVALPVLRKPHSARTPRAEYERPLAVLFQERIRQKGFCREFSEIFRGFFRIGVPPVKAAFDFGHFFLPLGECGEIPFVFGE